MPVNFAELDTVASAATGRSLAAAARIGAGRNSRVYRVTLAAPGDPESVVIKFYRRDPGDPRDRLAAEYNALEFLWRYGVHGIPRPIKADRDHYCSVIEFIAGEPPQIEGVGTIDIDACVSFLAALKDLSHREGADRLGVASEACFSVAELIDSVESRRRRLTGCSHDAEGAALHTFLAGAFDPLWLDVRGWITEGGWLVDSTLPLASRTLSPSDFGFHNAIRRADGSLAFVDFEYFGWDDPAKGLSDFLLHPGMPLRESARRRFAGEFLRNFCSRDSALLERARIVYPILALKWCLILLNEFLPERIAASAGRVSPSERTDLLAQQMHKAETMARRTAAEYRDNPYLTQ